MTPSSFESHVARLQAREWQVLLKRSVLYAHAFGARVFGGPEHIPTTGEAILAITLTKIAQGCEGYQFKDGDILCFYYLCRCCRRTVLGLYLDGQSSQTHDKPPVEEDEDTPPVLTERAALHFLSRNHSADRFLEFVRSRKLKGKLRAYATGFARYGAESWEVARIAKDLRVTPATIGKYRSQLRLLLEEFELERARQRLT
jgi:hypothetical protein